MTCSSVPTTTVTVTNINRGGMWVVVQTLTIEYGPFESKTDADRFAHQHLPRTAQ